MSNHRITPKWAFSNNALINLAYAKFKKRGSWEAFGYFFRILVRLSKTIFSKKWQQQIHFIPEPLAR